METPVVKLTEEEVKREVLRLREQDRLAKMLREQADALATRSFEEREEFKKRCPHTKTHKVVYQDGAEPKFQTECFSCGERIIPE